MAIFVVAFVAILIGLALIVLLKKTSPPPPQEQVHFDNPEDKPLFLLEREEFKEKCLEFFSKFNLEYRHSVWGDDDELEMDLQDETPVVGGKYLALCIFDPPNNVVNAPKTIGFLDTIKGEGAARGILITTGYFSDEAVKAVDEEPVELVNITAFISYLKKFEIYD